MIAWEPRSPNALPQYFAGGGLRESDPPALCGLEPLPRRSKPSNILSMLRVEVGE
jgi:hypothetical protein